MSYYRRKYKLKIGILGEGGIKENWLFDIIDLPFILIYFKIRFRIYF